MDGVVGGAIGPKFRDPLWTADGRPRASVAPDALMTLWFNTGTLCNLACGHCYIESSPRNDALVHLTAEEVGRFLDEAVHEAPDLREVGFTGGEPFVNRDLTAMLADALGRGLDALVLTNATRPLTVHRAAITELAARFGARLGFRVSLDHFNSARHEAERGPGTFAWALEGLRWLSGTGARVAVAGRLAFGLNEEELRRGYAAMFAEQCLSLDADDPRQLVLFPEMDGSAAVPEIAESCWDLLGVRPQAMMCASSRMVVRRRGADRAEVMACTLIADDERFRCGTSLAEARRRVWLSHPHCSRFCVLGNAKCG